MFHNRTSFRPLNTCFPFVKQLSIILLLHCISTTVFCQWDGNPATVNNPVLSFRGAPIAVSDDAGGALVVMSSYGTLVAQRKSVTGKLLWDSLPAPKVLFNGTSINVTDVQKDGHGGAYIAFSNTVSSNQVDIYLQRIDSGGNSLFGENGVKVNLMGNPLNYHGKLSVGKNGVTVVWGNSIRNIYDLNDSIINNSRLYIQRFSITGTRLWSDAMPVSLAPTGRVAPVVITDGNDGTYVAFTDFRNLQKNPESWGYPYVNCDIYMQYFDALGNRKWGTADSALSAQPGEQLTYEDSYSEKTGVTDSAGGFEIIYKSNELLCAQRVNGTGTKYWPQDFNIGGDDRTKYGIQAISDRAGGLVASYLTVPPSNSFIYAQKVTPAGTLPWGQAPLTVNSPGDQQISNPSPTAMAVDNEGDFIFCWNNAGSDSTDANNVNAIVTQLKGQKINSTGSKIWKPQGIIIYHGPNSSAEADSPQLIPGAANKTIAVWFEASDSIPNGRINSAMINPNGDLFDNLVRVSETIKDGNWNDASIWADGKVPSQQAAVIIKNNVTVSQNITCKSLQAVAPGTVTVITGFIITITG